jgi:hypothetical protein
MEKKTISRKNLRIAEGMSRSGRGKGTGKEKRRGFYPGTKDGIQEACVFHAEHD